MNSNGQTMQKLPFAAEKDSAKFFQEVMLLLIREIDKKRQKYSSTDNFQVFHHGVGWDFNAKKKTGSSLTQEN